MITCFSMEYLDSIYNLGFEINPKYNVLYDEKSLNNDVNKTYLYVLKGKLVGFIHIQELVDEIDIIDIVIDNKYRNKGYASKLLKYIFNKYIGKKFVLDVNVNNIPAINLYNKHNFIEINRRKGYYSGTDAIIMEKK